MTLKEFNNATERLWNQLQVIETCDLRLIAIDLIKRWLDQQKHDEQTKNAP